MATVPGSSNHASLPACTFPYIPFIPAAAMLVSIIASTSVMFTPAIPSCSSSSSQACKLRPAPAVMPPLSAALEASFLGS
eukprot:CAMPEP_0202367146 /NCGR_PEP_ID=MMETSP1126-20121109/17476_1 /ASSEMBLY_ACC=CAM_ASM_000457 /TAXON_ID=3047 /ORGANISM="Dunaliella tertiolecta, Strain CCMP1320" /LENGTH=79 /DNA_ID=CAMNT_0048962341 /DNA_START=87 /DNA_END=327 /DNA_ORIENTATION=-